ncbi:lysoplasmalogenase [Ruminococcaceae bacterium OttesenSCG-928-I18]|nr:lysoplasmalogenase [Ruminococcaceae bacterium OttesenSCG-928-I18]
MTAFLGIEVFLGGRATPSLHLDPQSGIPGYLLAFLLLYTAGLCVLLWVARKMRRRYPVAKGVLSAGFVLGSVLAYLTGQRGEFLLYLLLLGALVFCASGDILLGIANKSHSKVRAKPFVAGSLCFLLAHLFFCTLFFTEAAFRPLDLIFPAVLVALLFYLSKKGKIRLKKMWPLGYSYTALVGLMASKAVICGFRVGILSGLGLFTAVGAVLFLVSDVILLFLYFGVKRLHWLRTGNLITYYSGIALIGLSAHWY